MNKLLKCAFGLLTLITLNIACFSNANLIIEKEFYTKGAGSIDINSNNGDEIICVKFLEDCGHMQGNFGINYNMPLGQNYTISNVGTGDFALFYCILTNTVNYLSVWSDRSCPLEITHIKSKEYTSLQCQTEYNLIPISEVTPNYCKLNFGMIDPQECPINSGTGAIVRSNLMINDIPYAQNQNINVFIPDFLAWNIAFNDFNTVIEVEGYNADEEYIENVINQEKLTPTPEDLTYLIQGTANFIPYLFVGLLILFAVKIFGKIWK